MNDTRGRQARIDTRDETTISAIGTGREAPLPVLSPVARRLLPRSTVRSPECAPSVASANTVIEPEPSPSAGYRDVYRAMGVPLDAHGGWV